jgi:hypothetical protein
MNLSAQDDFLHPPTDAERWWTETYWFSFDDPDRGLSGTFYPLLRRNLDIAALTVAVWSPEGGTPWDAPYYRSLWHLKAPDFAGNRFAIEGLAYEVLEPLHSYRVTYDDAPSLRADLEITGLTDNFVPIAAPERGHWDQPTTVTGWLQLGDERIELDCLGMRDRSWGPRLDDASTRAAYVYGLSRSSCFLVVTSHTPSGPVVMGFIERDGERSPLAGGTVTEERDAQHRPVAARIEVTDQAGRELTTSGTARNHLAKSASPGMFAWMTMMQWDVDDCVGQFQDVWSPDHLAARARGS